MFLNPLLILPLTLIHSSFNYNKTGEILGSENERYDPAFKLACYQFNESCLPSQKYDKELAGATEGEESKFGAKQLLKLPT